MLDKKVTLDRLGDALERRVQDDHSVGSPEDVFDLVVKHDPTGNQKYGKWMLDRYIRGGIGTAEDFARVGSALAIFDKQKRKPHGDGPVLSTKEINQIKSLSELENLVEPFLDVKTKREIKAEILAQTEIIYDGPKGKIVVPKTEAASCFWGKATRWCTTSDNNNYFDHYNSNGKLYIVILRNTRKYQFHFEKNQFCNSRNDDINEINFFKKNLWILKSIFKTDAEMISKYRLAICFIKNFSEESKIEVVGRDGLLIRYIKNPSEQVQMIAVKQDAEAVRFIADPSERVQLEAVRQSPWLAIRFIDHPLESVLLAAVKRDSDVIQLVESPSDEMKLAATSRDGRSIRHIKNPSMEMQLSAVRQNGMAIQYIKKPSEEIKLEAVRNNGQAIQHIKNPSEQLQLTAVRQNPQTVVLIKKPSDTVKLAAVQEYGLILGYIKNPSEEIKLVAVKQNGLAVYHIKKPSEEIQMAAVEQNKEAIQYIKKPTLRVLEFVNQS